MTGDQWDVAILGAGAAGLMAAIHAAERGRSVLLLEKNRRAGVKILMSGGTRCNITNARGLRSLRGFSGPVDPAFEPEFARGPRSILTAFGTAGGSFLGPALRAFDVEHTIGCFECEGVATKVEANGKIFPVSDRAIDVLEALLRRLGRSGARLVTDCPVLRVARAVKGFEVRTPAESYRASRVLVAVGGQSYPGCGTTGDGYGIARSFGHTIVEPRPALVPLKVGADWVPLLRGLTVPDARAIVQDHAGRLLAERREAVLFAHFGLTGPAILDVSRAVARVSDPAQTRLRLDFAPAINVADAGTRIQTAARSGRPSVVHLMPADLPRRLCEELVRIAGVPIDRIGPELSRDERKRLLATMKDLPLPIIDTLGFAKAEVTTGGIALEEIDSNTLESRRQPGVHFAGEVLDLDGPIGGFNFQAAWSTGWLAGESV
jgi:predicted Rossmann fold flavoprotein